MKINLHLSALLRSVLAVAFVAGAAVSAHAVKKDVGYVSVKDNTVWEYDGYATQVAENMSVGVKLTADMMQNYAGCKIVGFKAGWSCSVVKGSVDFFIREDSFNAPDKASKHATLSYKPGWNTITLSEPYQIPDEPTDIYIGYHLTTPEKLACIPFSVFGSKPANSAYISFDDDLGEDGKPIWTDISKDFDALLLVAVVEVGNEAANAAQITDIVVPSFQLQGETATGRYTIMNQGTSPISEVTMHFTCGEETRDITVPFSTSIAAGQSSKVYLPVPGIASGETTVAISKVNGKDNSYKASKSFPVVAIPESVAEQYERRPLVEYYGSETSHHNVNNFDTYMMEAYRPYEKKVSMVCHHVSDQFMMREDEDLQMLLDLADGDIYAVAMPAMTLDRAVHVPNVVANNKSVAYAVLVAPFAYNIYNDALAIPTFASIDVENVYDADREKVNITVSGNVAPNVLPAGEKLKLTVYVLENNVSSTAQTWDTPEQEEAYGGVYNHQNVIRQQPTPIWGVELDGDGDFVKTFSADIDPEEWKVDDMRVVALLHRSEKNDKFCRQVVNCNEAPLATSSIREITADGNEAVAVTAEGCVTVNGSTDGVRVYTLSGALTANRNLPAGMYIVNAGSVTAKVIVK